jgi:hypothetical protein
MKLFRGIAVPKPQLESVITEIHLNGIVDQSKASYPMKQERLNDLHNLHLKPDLSSADTRPGTEVVEAVCACGDKDGALYYASKHNTTKEKTASILIEVDVQKSSLMIDGRDFLYTVFMYPNQAKARPVLEKCFGSAILKYADRAWSSKDAQFRVSQCDLATQDPAVIEAHYANDTVLAGRYNTIFRSAFTIKLPISPTSIISVYSPNKTPNIPQPSIDFRDIIELKTGRRT